MPGSLCSIIVERVPDRLVVENRLAFRHRLLDHLESGADVIVTFRHTRHVDTSALGVLMSASKLFRDAGRSLEVCGLNEDLTTLFALTRMDSVFHLHADIEAAYQCILNAAA